MHIRYAICFPTRRALRAVSISSSPMMPSLITLDTWRASSYLHLFVRLSLFSSLLSSTRVCLWFLSRPVRLCSNWTLGVQSATKGDRLSIALRERPVTPIRNGETIRRKDSAASGLGNGRGCSRRARREDTLWEIGVRLTNQNID